MILQQMLIPSVANMFINVSIKKCKIWYENVILNNKILALVVL